jgi:hypothetical protein
VCAETKFRVSPTVVACFRSATVRRRVSSVILVRIIDFVRSECRSDPSACHFRQANVWCGRRSGQCHHGLHVRSRMENSLLYFIRYFSSCGYPRQAPVAPVPTECSILQFLRFRRVPVDCTRYGHSNVCCYSQNECRCCCQLRRVSK